MVYDPSASDHAVHLHISLVSPVDFSRITFYEDHDLTKHDSRKKNCPSNVLRNSNSFDEAKTLFFPSPFQSNSLLFDKTQFLEAFFVNKSTYLDSLKNTRRISVMTADLQPKSELETSGI
jgi:hypothetical protein